MTGVVYPTESGGNSGGTYTVGYNTLGQPTTLSDGTTDPLTGLPVLINNATYGPAGELLTITGSTSGGYNETRTYNSRLQLTSLNGGDIHISFECDEQWQDRVADRGVVG